MAERRRGATLERALLEAAWAELVEKGYAKFTLDAVAARAGTSTPVLYRRWSNKHDLLLAAIGNAVEHASVDIPDTGSLREDILVLLRQANTVGLEFVAMLSVHLGGLYQETGISPADLRDSLAPGLPVPGALAVIYQRAAERGEIDLQRVTARMRTLPFDLVRAELMMTLQPIAEADIVEIVDTLFLPLVLT